MKGPILVVEDNALNRELVVDLLEINGYRVLEACEAEEGLRLARLHLPACILMDLSLPGLDGLAAIRRLKTDLLTRHLPVIALTAHAMRGDEDTARAAGCDGYLTKPINTRTFLNQMEEMISQIHAATPPSK